MSIEDGDEGVPGLSQLDPIYSYIVVVFNTRPTEVPFANPVLRARTFQLHPVQVMSTDEVVKKSSYEPSSGYFTVPATTTSVRPMEEILKLLPGPHSETKRGGFASSQSLDNLQGDSAAVARRSLVLVVFIGGVTFAEISALRFLSGQEGMAHDLIIGTTKIINGNSLIETFLEKVGLTGKFLM